MIYSDKNFVRDQISASEYAGSRASVLIKSVIEALDKFDVEKQDDENLEQWMADAISLFRSQPIVAEDDRQWADFLLGDVAIRDTVRVRPDAYSGGAARRHNGRVGKVVGTQGRKFSVSYEDKSQPPIDPVLHEFTLLQRLVK